MFEGGEKQEAAPKPIESTKTAPNPIAVGRCWNDVAGYLSEGKMDDVFGEVVAKRVKVAYFIYFFETLDIPYDKSKLIDKLPEKVEPDKPF